MGIGAPGGGRRNGAGTTRSNSPGLNVPFLIGRKKGEDLESSTSLMRKEFFGLRGERIEEGGDPSFEELFPISVSSTM